MAGVPVMVMLVLQVRDTLKRSFVKRKWLHSGVEQHGAMPPTNVRGQDLPVRGPLKLQCAFVKLSRFVAPHLQCVRRLAMRNICVMLCWLWPSATM